MAEIRLWNTKTKRKDALEPTVQDGKVSVYVCGPTVYDRAHMGNARPAIVFDVLVRLLRHAYGPGNVRYVRNLTDVDDKIIRRAEESGRPIDVITEETIQWYHADMASLGVLPPDEEPRATLAKHRVELAQHRDAALQVRHLHAHGFCNIGNGVVAMRKELVYRRIEQADRYGAARHNLEQRDEVLALGGQELGQGLAARLDVLGEDHLPHGDAAGLLAEHLHCAAEPDACGPERAGLARIFRVVRVGAHVHAPEAIGPRHQDREVIRQLRLAHTHPALNKLTGCAVNGNDVGFVERDARGFERFAF